MRSGLKMFRAVLLILLAVMLGITTLSMTMLEVTPEESSGYTFTDTTQISVPLFVNATHVFGTRSVDTGVRYLSGEGMRLKDGSATRISGEITLMRNLFVDGFVDFFIGVGDQSNFIACGLYKNDTKKYYLYTDGCNDGHYALWIMREATEEYEFAIECTPEGRYYIWINGIKEAMWWNPKTPPCYQAVSETCSYKNSLNAVFKDLAWEKDGEGGYWNTGHCGICIVEYQKYTVNVVSEFYYFECLTQREVCGYWRYPFRIM